jgi:hypothetical protein
MSFWWVNHKQTFKVEFEHGYIWSPQQKKNGNRNQAYDNLPRTNPEDIIFSYASGMVQAVGKVIAPCKAKERPEAFGSKGQQWDNKGWLVPIQWYKLLDPFIPKNHLDDIVPLLPTKHSPLRANGKGNQGIYLAELSNKLGNILLSLINRTNFEFMNELDDMAETKIEEKKEEEIKHSKTPETVKLQLIRARVGQGLFRENVEKIEKRCRITGLDDKRLLTASHIKPWKDATNTERLDGNNGLLLSPHVDKLFDKGWISFENNGALLISKHKILRILKIWHIDPCMQAGRFNPKQKEFLDYHRNKIFQG